MGDQEVCQTCGTHAYDLAALRALADRYEKALRAMVGAGEWAEDECWCEDVDWPCLPCIARAALAGDTP